MWIDDQVKVGEEIFEHRYCLEKYCRKQIGKGFEPTRDDAVIDWLID